MSSLHLVIPDLFLPKDLATETYADLHFSALTKLLARGSGVPTKHRASLEMLLSRLFFQSTNHAPIAAISATYDGLIHGNWLRADPVNLRLQRDQMLLNQVSLDTNEAAQFCASLNAHFKGQDIEFFTPHPQRWYLRSANNPSIHTTPLPELFGCNIRSKLPIGDDAQHWQRLFNEIQMLLHAHPLNEVREIRGDLPVNSVWFWGEGQQTSPTSKNYQHVSSDDELVAMFAAATGIPFSPWNTQWNNAKGKQLLVWSGLRTAIQSGDLISWRNALQDFEVSHAQPLWQALKRGDVSEIKIDVLAGENSHHFTINRHAIWKFWQHNKPLADYSIA